MAIKFQYTFFLCSLFSFFRLFCADIGSDSSVTRFATQQPVNDGDRIASFAALEEGFKLASSIVTGSFDSFFEVSGAIELNSGTLSLMQDLVLRDSSQVVSLGNIIGNGHTMELCSSVTYLPFGRGGSSTSCSCEVSYLDAKNLNGDGDTVDFSYDSKYVAVGVDTGTLKSVVVYEVQNGQLVNCFTGDMDYAADVVMVRWHPSKHLLAIARKSSSGAEIKILELNTGTCALTQVTNGAIGLGTDAYAVSWRPPLGDYIAVASAKSTDLEVYEVSQAGAITTPAVAGQSTNTIRDESLDWSPDGSQIVVGMRVSFGVGKFAIYDFDDTPASESLSLNVDSGNLSWYANSVDWNKTYSAFIAVGLQNSSQDSILVYQHEGSTNHLTQVSSFPGATPRTYFVRWNNSGLCLAVGSDTSDGSSGVDEFQTFGFDPISYSLSTISKINIGSDVRGIGWSPNDRYVAIGTDGNQVQLYEVACTTIEGGGCFRFWDLEFSAISDLLLGDCCITFSGQNVIKGHNNFLTLSPSCTLIIESDSSLQFRDITIKGIRDHGFYCTDDTATLSFHDVEIVLDNSYTFSLGKIDVLADLSIVGRDQTFAYQTSEVSTIGSCGRLFLGPNLIFSYDPPTASRDLIQFVDATSHFILNNATLHSTATGLRLSGGKIIFDGEPLLFSEGSVEAEAIVIASDMEKRWLPAAFVDCEGPVVYE